MTVFRFETLEESRQDLIEASLNSNPELKEAIEVFQAARLLVPMPVLSQVEPTRYSTSSSAE